MAALNADQEEEVAFANVLLIDPDDSRTKDAQAIRTPYKAIYENGGNATEVLKKFRPLEAEQSKNLSALLVKIRDSLLAE